MGTNFLAGVDITPLFRIKTALQPTAGFLVGQKVFPLPENPQLF